MLVRLRIFAQLKIHVMGSVSSKKKKRIPHEEEMQLHRSHY